MKTELLGYGDILTTYDNTTVPVDWYGSSDALEVLLRTDKDLLEEQSDNSVILVDIPADCRFKLTNIETEDCRSDWRYVLRVLDWPPMEIREELNLRIPLDSLNTIEFKSIEKYPVTITLRQRDTSEEETQLEDFSNIK